MTARSVLVIGASSGIGLATALRLAARGDRLTLCARSAEGLERAERECLAAGATGVTVVAGDIADASQARAMAAVATDCYGRIDAVVLTATVMAYGRVEDIPAEVFTTVADVAVHGTLHVAQAVMPVLREQGFGVFVVVNSLLGSVAVPQMGAYATAKWGQRALVRSLQQETRDKPDIDVCLVSPGSTNTPIYYQAANYTGRAARPPAPVQQPERTAAAILGLIDRPRPHVSIPVGPANPIVIAGFRFTPWLYDRLVGPLFRLAALARDPQAAGRGNVASPRGDRERVHGKWPSAPKDEYSRDDDC